MKHALLLAAILAFCLLPIDVAADAADPCDNAYPSHPDDGVFNKLDQQVQDVAIQFTIWAQNTYRLFTIKAVRQSGREDVVLDQEKLKEADGQSFPACSPHYYNPDCDYFSCEYDGDPFYQMLYNTCDLSFISTTGNILKVSAMDYICDSCHTDCFQAYCYKKKVNECCPAFAQCIEENCGGFTIDTDNYYKDCNNDGTHECVGKCTSVIQFEKVDACACPGTAEYILYSQESRHSEELKKLDSKQITVEDTGDQCLEQKDCTNPSDDDDGNSSDDDDNNDDDKGACGCQVSNGDPTPWLGGLMVMIGLAAIGLARRDRRQG